jgi:uncharacterized protein DUF4386
LHLSGVANLFAGVVLGSLVVNGDSAATVHNILAHETVFRLAFAADLITVPLYWLLSLSVPKSGSKPSFGNPSWERFDAYIANKKLVELSRTIFGNRYDWYRHKIREQLYFARNTRSRGPTKFLGTT